MTKIKLLHVYAQQHEHDSVFIVGNTEGLCALRNAINGVFSGMGGRVDVSVADGEGFEIRVIHQVAEWQSPEWLKLAMPYTSESSAEKREGAVWPEELFS